MEVATSTASPPAGAIADPGAARGKLALTDIRTAQPISAAMLQPLSGLAPRVPAGYRAISLQTTDEIAVGGLLKPGDKVDVQLVLRVETLAAPGLSPATASGEARSLLESLLVLAVGTQMTATEGEGESATPARTVPLAGRADPLRGFTTARSLGTNYPPRRNPADATLTGSDQTRQALGMASG